MYTIIKGVIKERIYLNNLNRNIFLSFILDITRIIGKGYFMCYIKTFFYKKI